MKWLFIEPEIPPLKTGLEIKAALDTTTCQSGIKVSDQEYRDVNLCKKDFHGEWNNEIRPVNENICSGYKCQIPRPRRNRAKE